MKKGIVLLLLWIAVPLYSEYFYIKDYRVDIQIGYDGVLDIEEKILVHFTEPRHGILRFIPLLEYGKPEIFISGLHTVEHICLEYAEMLIDEKARINAGFDGMNIPEDFAVAFGKPVKYAILNQNLRIGSLFTEADGDHEYVIRYQVYHAVTGHTNFIQLYWNIIGTEWKTEIKKASFTITLPPGVNITPENISINTGYKGEKGKNAKISILSNVISGKTLKTLYANQGLTIMMKFSTNSFAPVRANILTLIDSWLTSVISVKTDSYYWFIMPGSILLVVFLLWFIFGRDRVGVLTTEFFPPKSMNPAEAGMLINDKMDPHDILSLIYYWAVKKKLKIEKQKDGFYLRKLASLDSQNLYETELFGHIFYSGNYVGVKEMGEQVGNVMYYVRDSLKETVKTKKYYTPGMRKLSILFGGLWKLLFWGTFVLFLFDIEFRFVVRFPTLMPYVWILQAALFIASFVFLFFSSKVHIFTLFLKFIYPLIFTLLIVSAAPGISVFFGSFITMPLMLSFFLSAFVFRSFRYIIMRKTDIGMKWFRRVKGFAEFIARAEKDQLKRLVDERIDYFEMTLPYAIAFGMAKEWIAKFKGIQLSMPSWLTGSGVTKDYDIDMFQRDMENSWRDLRKSYTESSPTGTGDSSSSDSSWSSGSSSGGSSSSDSGGSSGGGSGGGGGSSW
ncbi:MAG: hypothetical protein A2Y33_13930 [Spirochaetes bacterium GWF1_51_8]|nr:MAG: hypothetical protein A2Y33_13930 [Spirochaetes bacterium GWF1_51_8]